MAGLVGCSMTWTSTDMRHHIALHPDLAQWAVSPGGLLFCTRVREHIANGGKLNRRLALRMTDRERADLIDLFGDAVNAAGIHLPRADTVLRSSRHTLPLRMLIIGAGGPIRTKRGQARYRAIIKRDRLTRERTETLAAIADVSQLAFEYELLAALPDDNRRVPPDGSRAATSHWITYCAALRAAAEWFRTASHGWKCSERELAALALGGTKTWTDAAKAAFSNLVGLPFTEAVHTSDTGLRMTGPAEWHRQGLVADLTLAEPFIELPGWTVARAGRFDLQARGVLLIENQETFEAVASRTIVPRNWLCIWTEGFASGALVHFLGKCVPESLPIAAWGDLDPPGIGIIRDLAEKSGRTIQPIGMDADLYRRGRKLVEEPTQLEKWLNEAKRLAETVPDHFEGLVAAMIEYGGLRCEQEGMHQQVLPNLHLWLAELKPL
ncbi:Wadjet anti-phage system protein JetD domain-containing protein [Streptomyces sp. NPDC090080]|uniref:Wadjet anti-phage system protein JetD domain-containing protein n=1 Tax=Streptomyces sp. NPDC090080 TaxID=3365939 RepID=UPI0038022233